MTDRLKAVGAYIFAGGFTVGVRDHFDVLAHLEGNSYGVDAARLNFPGMPIYVGRENWPTKALREHRPDFVYCNPPCAIFSAMGIRTTRGPGSWRTDPRVNCWHQCFSLLDELRPSVLAIESVQQAYTTGRELIDEFTRKALLQGYSVTHLLINAKWMGIPQKRRRFFFVAHRSARFAFQRLNWAPPPTIAEAITDAESPGAQGRLGWPDWLVEGCEPGEGLANAWERLVPEAERKRGERGQMIGRPSFKDCRLHPDRQMGAYLGDAYLHPSENRKLGINEAKALCGYPQDFHLTGPVGGYGSMLARAVMPPVGRWLAAGAANSVGADAAWGDRRVYRVALEAPPGDEIDITNEYLDANGRVRMRVRAVSGTPERVLSPPEAIEIAETTGPVTYEPPAVTSAPSGAFRAALDRREETGWPPTIPIVPPPPAELPPPTSLPEPKLPKPSTASTGGPTVVEGDPMSPKEGERSGLYLQRMWMSGFADPDALVAAVHRYWTGRTTTKSDVYYNYRKLIDAHGEANVPAWPRAGRRRETVAKPAETTADQPSEPALPARPLYAPGQLRALVTGMTPSQCGSTRRPLMIAVAGDAYVNALRDMGYAVEQRPVKIGEDLSVFDLVMVGIAPPSKLASHHALAALWALSRRPDAIGFVDDWQVHDIVGGFRSHVMNTERLWKNPYLGHKEEAEPYRAEIEAQGPRFGHNRWDIPVVVPVLGKAGDLSLLKMPADLIPVDPTPYWNPYPVPTLATPKERRWLWASLVQKYDQLDALRSIATWPVLSYGTQDKGMGGVGPRGERSLPRVPEPELVPAYAGSWGIATPAHAVSGSGWWRVRYVIAHIVGSIISGPLSETKLLGPSYLATIRDIEELSDHELQNLALAQAHDFARITWTRRQVTEVLASLFRSRSVSVP